MAEEQFTSRRARREAERLAAEQAFEAGEVPEQPKEAPNSRAGLLSPLPPKKPDAKPAAEGSDDTASRIDPDPSPRTSHERGALASDHPQESRPPVQAEDRLDPTRAPLPHFQTRAEKKRYLRENGLSLYGDLSTGALPVVADEKELAERRAAAEGRLTGPIPEVSDSGSADSQPEWAKPESDTNDAEAPAGTPDESSSGSKADAKSVGTEQESYDTAGFGGASEEVAARDFEAPVTSDSAPRPTTLDGEPYDALSMPYSALDGDAPALGTKTEQDQSADKETPADRTDSVQPVGQDEGEKPSASADEDKAAGEADKGAPADRVENTGLSDRAGNTDSADEPEPTSRSRRMPIVQPPSTSGVRVVTAASAQTPAADGTRKSDARGPQSPEFGRTDEAPSGSGATGAGESAGEAGSDDAARALAANPETRPMDAVPETWSLPNADYEDEETVNPPGSRIRASSVTGQDGQILMGEEPSKMPYIVLGVAAFFALALIVVALVMFL
ncbi:hypothetical protein SAMN04489752_2449 [Brevibacterium siliguriense]|uniref:Uncharacterized protein n=1 Tax=Brevibacterium siliguriense TaxID=1136497 RepID=A0A1H1UUH1_9MICO|nr:hypothetical protein [Brevibacterium siliguriense]SDS76125.1 hypothetical protein SAMN04489752_2449 [Brevibacterium siliguriense]